VSFFNFITKNIAFRGRRSTETRRNGPSDSKHRQEISIIPELSNAGHEVVPGVRVWYVPYGSNSDQIEGCAELTSADVAEFALIRNAGVRRRSLATRAALRRALSLRVDEKVAPGEWRFDRTDNGKPRLSPNVRNLEFSCSHTNSASIIAISTAGEIGIDIADAEFPAGAAWLADVMSDRERIALNELPEADRVGAISRLWTLKEAYVKMLGIGIAQMSEAAFDLCDDRLLLGEPNEGIAKPMFRTWLVNNQGHRLSVALAMSRYEASGAPSKRQSSEGSLVYPRSQLASFAKRARERVAPFAPVFRIAGSAQA
jgi:4'-phosphopantetheinyl transferase